MKYFILAVLFVLAIVTFGELEAQESDTIHIVSDCDVVISAMTITKDGKVYRQIILFCEKDQPKEEK